MPRGRRRSVATAGGGGGGGGADPVIGLSLCSADRYGSQ